MPRCWCDPEAVGLFMTVASPSPILETARVESVKSAVNSCDFGCIARSLTRDYGKEWTSEMVEALVEEYKRFFGLLALAPFPIVPSAIIDKAWHAHILATHQYASTCHAVAGKYLHHVPSSEMEDSEKPRAKMTDAYAKTKGFYKEVWGAPPDPRFWAESLPDCRGGGGSKEDAQPLPGCNGCKCDESEGTGGGKRDAEPLPECGGDGGGKQDAEPQAVCAV